MDLKLKGQVILVLGGAGFIGSEVVKLLKEEGATAVAASRSTPLSIDASDEASIRAGIDQVIAEHGRLDGLVVTSAPAAQTLSSDVADDADAVLEAINGKAITFLRAAGIALEKMREQGYGRIVAISGMNSYVTLSTVASGRNAVMNVAVKNLADRHAGTGITVNAISPGNVLETDAEANRENGDTTVAEVAEAIAFLLSPRTASISGEIISVGHKAKGVILP
ncbi:dehydrogenase [Corynebacterium suranareeae]|uniref:Dehydrogenase n=1 Tax=Corynebacterium suranareeae TaxID=2506452 RepID=A0A160PR06_9CORY|nr:SDR family oxidoreductase [Corynebacterium suranareeae]BAU94710.1 dehydrogenase [Corynebacterium suranareeae]